MHRRFALADNMDRIQDHSRGDDVPTPTHESMSLKLRQTLHSMCRVTNAARTAPFCRRGTCLGILPEFLARKSNRGEAGLQQQRTETNAYHQPLHSPPPPPPHNFPTSSSFRYLSCADPVWFLPTCEATPTCGLSRPTLQKKDPRRDPLAPSRRSPSSAAVNTNKKRERLRACTV